MAIPNDTTTQAKAAEDSSAPGDSDKPRRVTYTVIERQRRKADLLYWIAKHPGCPCHMVPKKATSEVPSLQGLSKRLIKDYLWDLLNEGAIYLSRKGGIYVTDESKEEVDQCR